MEIDETKIGRRKYNRGRLVDGKWLIGLIERSIGDLKGRFILAVCQDRTEESLVDIIRTHVAPGSTVHTDGWPGYLNLN